MRLKNILRCLLLLPIVFTSSVCASTNNEIHFLQKIRSELLVHDSQALQSSLNKLEFELHALLSKTDTQHIELAQQAFLGLVESWKSVEALFLAGNIDSDLLDHPAYIDHFHQGNESIPQLLNRVLQNNTELNKALFKHSSRSINALDYLLFPSDDKRINWQEDSSRRIKMAIFIVDQIQPYANEIADFYRSDREFVKQPDQSIAAIFNALVASSYKLKNWRVGEAGGLVEKTGRKPSASHLEYHYSGYSLHAIKSILRTHKYVFEIGNSAGYFQRNPQVDPSDITFMQQRIEIALGDARAIRGNLKDNLASPQYQSLFESLTKLHDAYYFMLIDALGIQAQIVDADGD